MQAEQQGLRRAVDVGVENAHPRAFGHQRQRQVHRGGGLAHPALAGSNGNDVLHARQQRHATLGSAYTFKASLNGKYASAENLHWYANGAEIKAAAGMTSITVKVDASMLNTSYKIHAAIVYNGSTVNSNSLAVSIDSGVTSESGSQSGSSSGSTSSSSSSSASSGS